MQGEDNRHILYLKEGGGYSDMVYGELKHLHQADMDDNFKVYSCSRSGKLPDGVRGAPTIYYMEPTGVYRVVEAKECMELVSRMVASLMQMRSQREQRVDSGARHPGRAPPIASATDTSGGRGESFREELFKTKHRQDRPSEAGPLQPNQNVGGPKVRSEDLAAWEAARIAADRVVDGQYGPGDGGHQGGQSQPYYPSQPAPGEYQTQLYQPQNQQYQPRQYNPQQTNGMAGNRMY
jgi:hypothetical protein